MCILYLSWFFFFTKKQICGLNPDVESCFSSTLRDPHQVGDLLTAACVCASAGGAALSPLCFISIRAQCLERAAVTWSQREIELNVSEPPWALLGYSQPTAAPRLWLQEGESGAAERRINTEMWFLSWWDVMFQHQVRSLCEGFKC